MKFSIKYFFSKCNLSKCDQIRSKLKLRTKTEPTLATQLVA